MMQFLTAVPHELPHWSPFAIAFGAMVGFLAGCYCALLYALWLQRRARLPLQIQRRILHALAIRAPRPDPAEKLPPRGTILYPLPPIPRPTTFGPTEVRHG